MSSRQPVNGKQRELPLHDLEAEVGVVGSLILSPDLIDGVRVIVRPDQFFTEVGAAYRALLDLRDEGKGIDPLTVISRVKVLPEYEGRIATAELSRMIGGVPTAAHAIYYAEIVRDFADRRAQIALGHEIVRQAAAKLPPRDIDGLIDQYVSNRPPDPKQETPTMRRLQQRHTELRPPVVHGLLREGETLNVIAPPKTGKSWLATDLALCVVTGKKWLGMFPTVPGNVLILDNELHPETSAFRGPKVAEALGIGFDEYADHLYVDNVRGQPLDMYSLATYFQRYKPGTFKLIVIDALYKFLPSGVDENSNPDMARMYGLLDGYASRLRCSFVCIHHASKGNQSSKAVTDVGAGAGAQSRAVDTHLILRPHEVDGVSVVDGVTRSFSPFEPFCLRWEFPVWTPAPECNPAELRREKRAKEKPAPALAMSEAEFVEAFASDQPRKMQAIIAQAVSAGIPETTATKAIKRAAELELIFQWPNPGDKRVKLYATVAPPPQNPCEP